jgi:hypothetical protein
MEWKNTPHGALNLHNANFTNDELFALEKKQNPHKPGFVYNIQTNSQ